MARYVFEDGAPDLHKCAKTEIDDVHTHVTMGDKM